MNIADFINSVYDGNSDDTNAANITNNADESLNLIDLQAEADQTDFSESVTNLVCPVENLSKLRLRMLGYYDNDNQYLKEEKEYPDKAKELANLLALSFQSLDSEDLTSEELRSVLNAYHGKAVFVFKDKNNSLYAYWPLENIARLTDVTYNKMNITQVSIAFKNWFVPGEPILNKSNTDKRITFYDYIRNNVGIDEKVSVKIQGKSNMEGVIKEVGSDFLVLSTSNNQELVISNSIVLTRERQMPEIIDINFSQEEDDDGSLQANGYICQVDKDNGGWIFEYSTQRKIQFKLSLNTHLNDIVLNVNDKVIYEPYKAKNGWESVKSICFVNVVDACEMCKKCLQSEDYFQKATGKFILNRLKSEFPNDDRVTMLSNTKSFDVDESFNEICKKAKQLLEDGRYEEAEQIYLENIEKEVRFIPQLCYLYDNMYKEAELDEQQKEIQNKVLTFIDKYDQYLSDENMGLRRLLLLTIGKQELFEQFVDRKLSSCESNKIRSVLLRNKALLYYEKNDELYIAYLSESLASNPWDKNAEKYLNSILGFNDDVYSTFSVAVSLAEIPATNDAFLNNLFVNYKDTPSDLAQIQRKDAENQQDYSRINTSDFNNYTLKLIHCYKSIDASSLPGKTLASYCGSRALTMAREGGDLNSIRFLLLKSLAYVGGLGYFVRRNLYIYILSFSVNSGVDLYTSIPAPSKILDFKDAIAELTRKLGDAWVVELAKASMANSAIRDFIVDICYRNDDIKHKSKKIFEELYKCSIGIDFDDYKDIWTKHIDMIQQKQNDLANNLSISHLSDLENCLDILKSSIVEFSCGKEKEIIVKTIRLFEDSNKLQSIKDPSSKQRKSVEIMNNGRELSNDIFSSPTSVLCVLSSSISNLIELVDDDYQKTRQSFKNRISVTPISNNVAILKKDKKHSVSVVFEVMNEEGGLSISDLSLEVYRKGSENEQPLYYAYDFPLKSGDSWECVSEMLLSPVEIGNKYVELVICLKYLADSDSWTHTYKKTIKINLYSKEEFTPIHNPYSSGKALQKENENMFYGRSELMQQLESTFKAKDSYHHFIIYGQKRCGKSSFRNILASHLSDCDNLLVVSFELPDGIHDEYDFYRVIINNVYYKLTGSPNYISIDELEKLRRTTTSTEFFRNQYLKLKKLEVWGSKRLLLMIDEFTRICDGIKDGSIKNSILKDWKFIAEDSETQFGAVLFGHDITPDFLAEDYNRNANAILGQKKLTYLTTDEARNLIIKPVMDGKNSRYVGKSVTRIMEYTAKSPYYIQVFCKELIDYVNKQYSYRITLTDVETVAKMLYCNSEDYMTHDFSTINSFDNLISNGRHSVWNDYKDEELISVLRIIAIESGSNSMCSRERIHLDASDYPYLSEEDVVRREDGILKDLYMRDVIKRECIKGIWYYQIRVLLFKEWLVNHPEQ